MLTDWLEIELPQTFSCKKKKNAIAAKCNKTRYACVDGETGSQDHTAGECSIRD